MFSISIKSFYTALSHISIRGLKKITAGVIFSPSRNFYPRERPCKKKSPKNFFFAKVSQCRKPTHSTQHYLNTLPKTHPTLIHRGEDPSRLSNAISYLNIDILIPLAVLLAYLLLRIYILKKVFVQKVFYRHSLTVRKTVEQCRKYPIRYPNTLKQTIPYLNTLSRALLYHNTLGRTITYLNTLKPTIIYPITLNPN